MSYLGNFKLLFNLVWMVARWNDMFSRIHETSKATYTLNSCKAEYFYYCKHANERPKSLKILSILLQETQIIIKTFFKNTKK